MPTPNKPLPGSPIEAGIATYLHRKSAAAGIPLSGTFELTARCNFRCRMCYIHRENGEELRKTELGARKWIDLARAAYDAGMLFVLLTGGEPLIRADFPEIYEALSAMGLCVSINTNGSLLTGDTAALLIKKPPNKLNVSLYGASEETYQSVCGGAYYKTVTENIDRMLAAGVRVQLNVSLTPDNAGDAPGIFRFASERNIGVRSTPYMYPAVRCGDEAGCNPARFGARQAGVMRAKTEALQFGKEPFLRRAEAIENGSAKFSHPCIDDLQGTGSLCRAGRTGFWVDWRGNMSMCGMIEGGESVKDWSFAACWENIKRSTGEIRLPAACSACEDRLLCPVCAASCRAETGAFDQKPGYLCEMTRAYREEALRLAGDIKKTGQ